MADVQSRLILGWVRLQGKLKTYQCGRVLTMPFVVSMQSASWGGHLPVKQLSKKADGLERSNGYEHCCVACPANDFNTALQPSTFLLLAQHRLSCYHVGCDRVETTRLMLLPSRGFRCIVVNVTKVSAIRRVNKRIDTGRGRPNTECRNCLQQLTSSACAAHGP